MDWFNFFFYFVDVCSHFNYYTKVEKPLISTEEAKVMAENSVKLGEEIVSETLARLLARQGHKLESIEMYQKLILKYPEKQATFAAAIQKLKS